MIQIEIVQADITKLNVDVIVNAANQSLLGGSGVDGAIHRGAGPQLLEECRQLNGCKTGQAKITKGYKLPASYVIHTVGPIWQGGEHHESELLVACYQNSLALADTHILSSIAFPAISCGVYGYPIAQACQIAVTEVLNFIPEYSLEKVIFASFNDEVTGYLKFALTAHKKL